jgi:hypothetical protein
MNHAEARRLCDRWGPLWTGNRPEALAACYADDVFYRDPATPEGLHGRPALLVYLRKLLARNPDWVWTMEEIYPTDGGFCVRWLAHIPVGAERVVEKGMDLVCVENGLITRNEVYFDRTALLAALRAARGS